MILGETKYNSHSLNDRVLLQDTLDCGFESERTALSYDVWKKCKTRGGGGSGPVIISDPIIIKDPILDNDPIKDSGKKNPTNKSGPILPTNDDGSPIFPTRKNEQSKTPIPIWVWIVAGAALVKIFK